MKILECTNPKDACQLTYEQIKEAAIKGLNVFLLILDKI